MISRLASIALLGSATSALAQHTTDVAVEGATAKPVTQVEVKADYDPRRDDTASKTILTADEIARYGDTSALEVLKRAPGVTVVGGAVRMRGLGSGYTQILVNGERPVPGFSLETLPPEQIERIEVIRAATAEYSMQAIAGTINVILKRVVAKPQRDLRISGVASEEQRNVSLLGTFADRVGNLSYFLNPAVGSVVRDTPSVGSDRFITHQGQVTQLRDSARLTSSTSSFAGLQSRLNWKLPNDEQLNVSSYLQFLRGENEATAIINNHIGSFGPFNFVDTENRTESSGGFVGGDLNWVAKVGAGKLDAKISLTKARFHYHNLATSSTVGREVTQLRQAETVSGSSTIGSIGKYTRSLAAGHILATGWEINRQQTDEAVTRVEGFQGAVPTYIAEQFTPRVIRLAAYGQDEWNVTKHWSMYVGARWERIQTESEGTGLVDTRSRSQVLSPVAQTLYKFPDKSGRQLRLALTRTYKAPALNQLTARRYKADENTRFNPDSSGNPNLRPELANGIDLTYEHFWAPAAVFSVGVSQRKIRDYIRTRLVQAADGAWLLQPLNDGDATARTFDVELKFPLRAINKEAPPFDVRASVNRNWSAVAAVPGPNNRLDQQIPLTATIGMDYRANNYNLGASLMYRAGGPVRVSEQQRTRLFRRRELDAYWLYKFQPKMQLRVGVSNALGEKLLNQSRYEDVSGRSESWGWSDDSMRLQANLELKF